MPNIPKTGFKEVDELFNKPKEENTLNFLSVLTSSTTVNFKFQAFGSSNLSFGKVSPSQTCFVK